MKSYCVKRSILVGLCFCASLLAQGAAAIDESTAQGPVKQVTGTEDALAPSAASLLSAEAGGRLATDGKGGAQDAYRIPQSALTQGMQKEEVPVVPRKPPILLKGNDQTVKLPEVKKMVSLEEGAVSMRFERAPITEVLHAVLGDLLKIDYSIAAPLTGEITLHTQNPVPRDQLLSIIESLLLGNGIVMVPDTNGRYRIGPIEILKGATPIPRRIDSNVPGYSSVIIPLQNIGAGEMADILRPVAPSEAFLRVDLLRNLLVLAGTRAQIDGWLEIVSVFDVDLMKGMSIGLFPLEHASVKEVESTLRSLFASGDAAAKPAAPAGGPTAAGSGKSDDQSTVTAVRLAGPFGGLVRVLAIERLNALLVITPRSQYLDQARLWIEKIDRPMDADGEPQLYVYAVQNGSAQHLANLLNGLYAPQTTVTGQGATGIAPGLGTVTQGIGNTSSSGLSGTGSVGLGNLAASSLRGNQPAGVQQSVTQVSLGKDVRVVADNQNNALLIYAPKRDYKRIESALRQLDVAPNQVLIEASIVEVTLTDETKYGLQWYFEGGLGHGGWKGTGILSNATDGSISTAQQGFTYSVTNPLGAVRAVLNAMADKQLVNVISSPSLMVLDNQTASIQVGAQQPIRSSTTITEGGVTSSSIQYKDTGVLLTVTPSINSGSLVSMQISQAVSDVGGVDVATGQRVFQQRQIVSKVAVRSGEMVVLGGLIRDNKGNGKQGIPLLQDIPVLGALFSTTTIAKDRTELLVMITPRIIRNEQDVREVGSEFRAKMRDIKAMLGR